MGTRARSTPTLARALLLAWATAAGTATASSAQACGAFPTGRDELWLGGAVEWGAESPTRGGRFEFTAADRVMAAASVSWGGYRERGDRGASSVSMRLGTILSLVGADLCPFVEGSSTQLAFRDRFAVDYGDMDDRVYRVGVTLGRALGTLGPLELSAWIAPEIAYRRFEMMGSRLFIDTEVRVEDVHQVDHSYQLAGAAALMLRAGSVGVTAGLGSRAREGDDFMTFVRVGFQALRF